MIRRFCHLRMDMQKISLPPKAIPMTRAIIGRWGSSLAVRLPTELAASLNLREGERIDMDTEAGQIVIRRTKPSYTLEQMFAGKPADEWCALYADAFDWGPDVGQEIVED